MYPNNYFILYNYSCLQSLVVKLAKACSTLVENHWIRLKQESLSIKLPVFSLIMRKLRQMSPYVLTSAVNCVSVYVSGRRATQSIISVGVGETGTRCPRRWNARSRSQSSSISGSSKMARAIPEPVPHCSCTDCTGKSDRSSRISCNKLHNFNSEYS